MWAVLGLTSLSEAVLRLTSYVFTSYLLNWRVNGKVLGPLLAFFIQLRACFAVEDVFGLGEGLEDGGGDLGGDLAFDGLVDDVGFLLA